MSASRFTSVGIFDGDLTVTDPDALEGWTLLSVHRFAGGRQDYAVFRRELAQQGEQLEDMRTDGHIATKSKPQYISVWTLDDEGERNQPLFWGQLLKVDQMIGGPVDQETAVAVIVDHHFGIPIRGQYVWSVDDEDPLTIHLDPVFNPLVDGIVSPNMQALLTHEDSPGQSQRPYHLWIDPESSRSDAAIEQRGEVEKDPAVDFWTLREAVKTCCEWLGAQWFTQQITPPRDGVLTWRGYRRIDADVELFNVGIKRGSYLPAILDTLLPPHRYSWFVRLDTNEDETQIAPRIEFMPTDGQTRDEFPGKTLKRQRAGKQYDPNETHVISARISTDLSHLANVIECYGSLKAREVTLPLYRGWPEDEDAGGDLTKDGSMPNAWRRWIFNEAGDYKDLRPEITTYEDLNDIFGETDFKYTIPKRREIDEPLQWRAGAEGFTRQPVYLEYSIDDGDTWQAVPTEWGWKLLPNEIGVMFTGEEVPPTLLAAGDNARVRITGTIVGDRRISSVAARDPQSPLYEEIITVIDVSDRYHDRQISEDFAWGSQLDTGAGDGDVVDDQAALDALATLIRDENDHAHIAIEALLWGIRTTFEIGDILTKIEGKELSLASRAASAGKPRYPQIKELHWDLFQQTTRLVAST